MKLRTTKKQRDVWYDKLRLPDNFIVEAIYADLDDAQAEVTRLREALQRIADAGDNDYGMLGMIARAALVGMAR